MGEHDTYFYTHFNKALVSAFWQHWVGECFSSFFYQKPKTSENVLKGSWISRLVKESLGVFYENSKSVNRLWHASGTVPPLLRQVKFTGFVKAICFQLRDLSESFWGSWVCSEWLCLADVWLSDVCDVSVFISQANFNQQHSYLATTILRMWLLKMQKLKQYDHRKYLIFTR